VGHQKSNKTATMVQKRNCRLVSIRGSTVGARRRTLL